MKLDLKEWINKSTVRAVTVSGTTGVTHGEWISNLSVAKTQVVGVDYRATNVCVIPYYVNGNWGFAFRHMTDWVKLTSTNFTMTIFYVVVGGVVRKLLKALKPLTLGRGWAV